MRLFFVISFSFTILIIFNQTKLDCTNISLIKDKNLNESLWKSSLVKSFKSFDQILCVTYCIQTVQCVFAVFDSSASLCNHYSGQITNMADLVDSMTSIILYGFKSPFYELKGNVISSINTDFVICFAFLKNGDLASGGYTNYIKLWRQSDFSMIKSWLAHSNSVRYLLLLANGDLASSSDDTLVKIWNSYNWSLNKTLNGHPSYQVYSIGLLLSGYLVSGSFDATFKVWDLNTGISIKTKYCGHLINSMIVLKNGDIVTGGTNGIISIWNPITYELKKNLIGHTSAIFCLLEMKNGDLASGAALADSRILIWDMNLNTTKYVLTGHTSHVFNLIQLTNGDLASSSADRSIKIWSSSKEWTCTKTLLNHTQQVNTLIQLQNGYLASGSHDSYIKIWE